MAVEIKTIRPEQALAAKRVMIAVCLEIWQPPQTPDEFEREWDAKGEWNDLAHLQETYFDTGGAFLVLLDDDRVVGTAGLRGLSAEVCELKRMWFLPEYRGQGWGLRMVQMLIEHARANGFQKMRLDIFDPSNQERAMRLYRQLGFYEIERYNDGVCSYFMEKLL